MMPEKDGSNLQNRVEMPEKIFLSLGGGCTDEREQERSRLS